MNTFTVWISRRFWWPKKYICKGVSWGLRNEGEVLNPNTLCMTLANERRVYVVIKGQTVTYGRDLFELEVRKMEQEAGQKIPMKGVA